MKHKPVILNFDTYDGSGQTVHPDVLDMANYISQPWNGYRFWMVITPYPRGNSRYENPSIFVSNDGVQWVIPKGLTNPVYQVSDSEIGFCSDPCLEFWDNMLWLWFRETHRKGLSGGKENRILLMKTSNGINWTIPVEVLRSKYSGDRLSSPSIRRIGSSFIMWSITGASKFSLLRRSSDNGVSWSAPAEVAVSGLPSGRYPWHIYVHTGGYHALLCSSTGNYGKGSMLHYGHFSDEGLSVMSKFLFERVYPFEASFIYRGSMIRKSDMYFDVYYSGRCAEGNWRTAVASIMVTNGREEDEK